MNVSEETEQNKNSQRIRDNLTNTNKGGLPMFILLYLKIYVRTIGLWRKDFKIVNTLLQLKYNRLNNFIKSIAIKSIQ